MRDLFFKDFGGKFFSLLLAAFIWYTVQKVIEDRPVTAPPANMEREFSEVPVTLLGAAAEPRLFQANSNSVLVTVGGPQAAIEALEPNRIHATVNLSGLDPKGGAVACPVEISVPWGVTVMSVEPADLRISPPAQP